VKTAWIIIAMAGAALAGDFSAGLAAYNKGDFAAALKEWKPLADTGSRDAQYNLGLLYMDGKGVPKSYEEAAKWFERAANQGQLEAQHNLGAMYGGGLGVRRDYVQAYKWESVCAARGNSGCASQRDALEKKLKGSKLAEAQRLATDFKPKDEPSK